MASMLSGVNVPRRKNTVKSPPVKLPLPREVILPMQMHIGKAATPVVKEGDTVSIGTLIGEADGSVSSPVHASISGMVTEICELTMAGGRSTKAVRIASDGENRISESVKVPEIKNRNDFIRALAMSGIVGLGGAGFPTHVKYDVTPSRIEEIIINAAECEPYITSDTCTMLTRADDIICAIEAFGEYLGVGRVIIGVEQGNYRAAISMKHLEQRNHAIEVKVLRDVYPQGAEKVLIYHTTGKVTPVGKLPIDVGCIVSNISTVAEIGKYLRTGMPLIERCVTVAGGVVREAQNVIVPVGVRAADVFEFCGGFCENPVKILYGGPMMGVSVDNIGVPVLKNTNALLALTAAEVRSSKTTSCIRCGSCFRSCPYAIDPAAIARARKRGALEAVRKLRVDACMECGCCSFVCPAKLPLVESNRLGKAELRRQPQNNGGKL